MNEAGWAFSPSDGASRPWNIAADVCLAELSQLRAEIKAMRDAATQDGYLFPAEKAATDG
jgi:hypothetical protein